MSKNILSPKGSVVGRAETPTPTSSQNIPPENEDMPDAPPMVSELRETLRVKLPDTYSGNRKDLEVFLLQVELYSHFNDEKFPTNESYALWTSSYLRGEALRWVEPFLKDYFLHEDTCGAMITTKNMFRSWKGFKKEIRRMFGDIDEVKTAEDHLYNLKQTGSALTYATEFQRHGNQTNWDTNALLSHYKRGLKSHVRMELARMEHQPKDMVSLIEHTVRIDNRLYEFQKEKRTYDGPKKYNKYRKNEGRRRDSHPRDNRWSDPMELDATFKPGRPRDPKKDRQFKERLCFNCDKPGHIARDCRQPKKGNGGRKFGKQLNATWQGQLNATFANKPDWGINGDSTPEGESSEEDTSDDGLADLDTSLEKENEPMNKGLTESQKLRLKEFEEDAKEITFKENLPGVVDIYRQSMLRKGTPRAIPVPPPPSGWQGTQQDWEVAVRAMRCRPGYPLRQEPRGAKHISEEATMWLKYKLAEYEAQDEQQRNTQGPEPWELRADEAAMDYEPTDRDVEKLSTIMKGSKLTNRTREKALEQKWTRMDATRTDHPWHPYVYWEHCSDDDCESHLRKKNQYRLFPKYSPQVYFTDVEQIHALRRSQSEGELPLKKEQVYENYPQLLDEAVERGGQSPQGPPLDADEYYPSSDESKN